MSVELCIVIPTYNCGGYLNRALSSAVEQTRPASRIIVVDDGSTDDTPDVVGRFGQRVEYVRQPRSGPFVACKRGIARTDRGCHVVFLDADDRLRPGYLQWMEVALLARPDTMLAFGQVILVDREGRQRRSPLPQVEADPLMNFLAYVRGDLNLSAGGGTFARHLFEPWFKRLESLGRVHGLDRVVLGQALSQHPVLVVPESEVEIHDRPGRLRDDVVSVCNTSLEAVDVLFDASVLPEQAMRERANFVKRLLLEQARLLYRAGRHAEAAARYRQIVAEHSYAALGSRHLRRYLVSCAKDWALRLVGGPQKKPGQGGPP